MRIAVVACDGASEADATEVVARIEHSLLGLGGQATACGRGASQEAIDHCMTWGEPGCQHVFVLIVGATPLHGLFESRVSNWLSRSGGNAIIVPALRPGLTHTQVFGAGKHPTLAKFTLSPWGGSRVQLAEDVLTQALLDERPGVFISYLRLEAANVADALHDRLVRAGYRVFLDRFQGTPGRFFPQELAEAMASMGMVLLLETAGLFQSKWTMWETAFAHRYGLGPVAVNFDAARQIRRVCFRTSVAAKAASLQPPCSEIDRIVDFVEEHRVPVAVARRSYYETLVRLAAESMQGTTAACGTALRIDEGPTNKGYAVPRGAPGKLRDLRRLHGLPNGRVLAGEHHHLPPADRDDLRWLADQTNVTLAGSASVYRAVRNLW